MSIDINMMTNTRHHDIHQLPERPLDITRLNFDRLQNDNKKMDTFELFKIGK